MSEIYWLTRLDSIEGLGFGLNILSVIALFVLLFMFFECAENKDDKRVLLKWIKVSVSTFIIGVLTTIFVPTTKEAMAIWGIGETIDYIKSNDKAKQLPDKCVDALDKFIEEYVEDK